MSGRGRVSLKVLCAVILVGVFAAAGPLASADPPIGSIRGTVVGGPEAPGPLAGVTVRAWRTAPVHARVSTETAPDGSYSLPITYPGDYEVTFEETSALYFDDEAEAIVSIVDTDVVLDVVFRVGARITGTVSTPASDPPPIYAYAPTGEERTAYAYAEDDGTYRLGPIEPGVDQVVRFGWDWVSDEAPEYYDDVSALLRRRAHVFNLSAGETSAGVDATLTGGGTIKASVRLRGRLSAPAEAARVSAWGWVETLGGGGFWDKFGIAQTGVDGTVTLRGLPRGEHVIEYGGHSSGALSTFHMSGPSREDASPVRVWEGHTTRIESWMTPDGSRAGGVDRYHTARLASQLSFDPRDTDAVVVASGEDFADGLSASGLAGAYRAPLLLTRPGSIDAETLAEIARLGVADVWVVGGPAAVSPSVVAAIRDVQGVQRVLRISGADRYGTAAAVAAHLAEAAGGVLDVALLVRGDAFPDAVAVSPYAYSQRIPILLTRPNELPPTTTGALRALGIDEVVIAGGVGAVSGDVARAVIVDGRVDTVGRVFGKDRYETAYQMAHYAIERQWAGRTASWADAYVPHWDSTTVGLATGINFPDALSAGPVLGSREGVLLYARGDAVPYTEYLFKYHDIEGYLVFGQTDVVSEAAVEDFYQHLEAKRSIMH